MINAKKYPTGWPSGNAIRCFLFKSVCLLFSFLSFPIFSPILSGRIKVYVTIEYCVADVVSEMEINAKVGSQPSSCSVGIVNSKLSVA